MRRPALSGTICVVATVSAARQPWAFTQQPPLSTAEFCREAKKRGVVIDVPTLRELYRVGLMAPFLEVRQRRPPATPVPQPAVLDEPLARGTLLNELRAARDSGRLVDPGTAPFRSRLRFEARPTDGRHWWNGLLYSPYQLLGLHQLRSVLSSRGRSTRAREATRLRQPSQAALDVAERDRRLAIVLTVLEAMYLPKLDDVWIRLTNADPDEWERYRLNFDPQGALAAASWHPDDLRREAERLLLTARSTGGVGLWTELIKRSPPRTWRELEGEPRVAMDHRVAAEILLLCHEDLATRKAIAPLPVPSGMTWHPLHERLSSRQHSLDDVLGRLGVSPHPPVVLILEGETEEYFAREIEVLLELRRDPEVVRILIASTTADLTKVAALAATPLLGKRRVDGWDLLRPPTRLMIAFDPDKGYATPAEVSAQRQKILSEIRKGIRSQGMVPDQGDLGSLVEITTWSGGCFEFSHFTNSELRRALRRVHPTCGGMTDTQLKTVLTSLRQRRIDISHLWKPWQPQPGKLDLARALLAPMRRRVLHAAGGHGVMPALATVVVKVHEIALAQPAGTFVMHGQAWPRTAK